MEEHLDLEELLYVGIEDTYILRHFGKTRFFDRKRYNRKTDLEQANADQIDFSLQIMNFCLNKTNNHNFCEKDGKRRSISRHMRTFRRQRKSL